MVPVNLLELNVSANGDGIMLYLRENIPSKLLTVEMSPSESFCIEIANLLLL